MGGRERAGRNKHVVNITDAQLYCGTSRPVDIFIPTQLYVVFSFGNFIIFVSCYLIDSNIQYISLTQDGYCDISYSYIAGILFLTNLLSRSQKENVKRNNICCRGNFSKIGRILIKLYDKYKNKLLQLLDAETEPLSIEIYTIELTNRIGYRVSRVTTNAYTLYGSRFLLF